MNAKTILTAAALAAAFVTGAAQAAPANKTGEVYGYSYSRERPAQRLHRWRPRQRRERTRATRLSMVPALAKADPFTDGARVGKTDPYTLGRCPHRRAGLDTKAPSASPARHGGCSSPTAPVPASSTWARTAPASWPAWTAPVSSSEPSRTIDVYNRRRAGLIARWRRYAAPGNDTGRTAFPNKEFDR